MSELDELLQDTDPETTSERHAEEAGQVLTDAQRALANINYATDINPEAMGAAISASKKNGRTVTENYDADNQEANKPNVDGMAPATQRFFGDSAANAAVSKGEEDKIDDIVRTADYAALSLDERRKAAVEDVKRNGYTWSQISDLRAAGYRVDINADGPIDVNDPTKTYKKVRVYTEDREAGRIIPYGNLVLEKWYTNPEELEAIKALHQAKREQAEQARNSKFENVRGSAAMVNMTPEDQTAYIQQLDKEIAAMHALYLLHPDWTEGDDASVQRMLNEAGKLLGIDVSDIPIKRLRPAGVSLSEVDWADAVNFYGIRDTFWFNRWYQSRLHLNSTELDEVHRDPLRYSDADRRDLVDELESQAKALRGTTFGNRTARGIIDFERFMVELGILGVFDAEHQAMTEGVAEVKKLLKAGEITKKAAAWKLLTQWGRNLFPHRVTTKIAGREVTKWVPGGLAALQSGVLKDSLIRLPGNIPTDPGVITQVIEDNQVLPGYHEKSVSELSSEFFNNVIDDYIETTTEGLGELLPGFHGAIKFIPERIRNAAFVRLMKSFTDKKVIKAIGNFGKRAGLSGIVGEEYEELAADLVRWASTQMSHAAGTNFGNLGQEDPYIGWEGEKERIVQLAIPMAAFHTGAAAVGAGFRAVDAIRFRAGQKVIDERIRAAATTLKRSPETLEFLLRRYTGLKDVAYLKPETAEVLFQSMPDAMRKLGVDDDVIGKAKSEERLIPVSMARTHTQISAEEFNTLLEKLIPDPNALLTTGEAKKIMPTDPSQLSAEVVKEREEFADAIDQKVKQLQEAGRSKAEIRAFMALLSHAGAFLGQHNTAGMTPADVLNNLTIISIKEPDFLKKIAEKMEAPSLYQGVIGIPGFYSNMMQSLEDAPQQKMTPAQWMAYLQKSGGLKAGETSWRGSVEKFFEGRDPNTAVDKQEIVDAFQDGMVDILEMSSENPAEAFGEDASFLYSSSAVDRAAARLTRERDQLVEEFRGKPLVGEDEESFRKRIFAINDALDGIRELKRLLYHDPYNFVLHGLLTPAQAGENIRAMYDYLERDSNLQSFLDEYARVAPLGRKWGHGEMSGMEFNKEKQALEAHRDVLNKLLRTNWSPNARSAPARRIEESGIRNEYTTDGLDYNREIVIYAPEVAPFEADDDIHFGTDTNGTALVWVRFGETRDEDGNHVLVIDEIQSNRHQAGRERGYSEQKNKDKGEVQPRMVVLDNIYEDGPITDDDGEETFRLSYELTVTTVQGDDVKVFVDRNGDVVASDDYSGESLEDLLGQDAAESVMNDLIWTEAIGGTVNFEDDGVPPAPFEKNWHELGMKRMIRYAAEHGYDKIAWTSGDQQAKRYNIGNALDDIELISQWKDGNPVMVAHGNRSFDFSVSAEGGIAWSDLSEIEGKPVHEVFGKELGERIMKLAEKKVDHEEKTLWLDNFRILDKNDAKAEIMVGGEEEFPIEVDMDGNIIGYTSPGSRWWDYRLKGNTVYEAFGEETGKNLMALIKDMGEGAFITLENQGSFKMVDQRDRIALGEDIVIGGEGMKTFYDRILKSFTEKYIKKWGAKVGVVELPDVEEAGREMWGFDVTPAMKAAVMGRGQPLFQSATTRSRAEVNRQFNEDLQKQIDGKQDPRYTYDVGLPGDVLLDCGLPNLPIRVTAGVIENHSKDKFHVFDIEELKNLPDALQNPVAVFDYHGKAYNVIVDLVSGGKHFLVGIHIDRTDDNGIVINEIRGLFPKDTHEWLNWIQGGKAEKMPLYLNKEKVKAAITGLRQEAQRGTNPHGVPAYLNLDTVLNIVENFENASLRREDSPKKSVTPEMEEEFVEAEKQGNYNEAQRLVDEAAGYDPKKATYPGDVAKVYHYGALGNDVFVADRPIHLGTEQAARERIPGKMKDDYVNSVEIYQDEDGRWTWAEPNGMESGMYFSSEEAVRRKLSNSDVWLEGEEIEGEAEKIHPYFISTENFKNVPDMIDQNGWDRAIAQAKEEGYRGIRYRNVVEDHGSWSYIVFNPEDMKLADPFTYDDNGNLILLSERFNTSNPDVRYQSGEKHRGAMTMDDDWKATIALFEGMADGSTAIHETAHYVFDMMEHFVESGLADERMQSDYKKLVDWMTLTPEQAAKGYEAYLKTVPEGTDAMSLEQWKYIEEQERFARGFEAYCMEGRAPSVELQGAFATLRRILLHIYKTVRALGVQLTDDVRQVFDGMLATETTLLRDSILLEAAEQIDRELLGLSQAEVKTFRDLIQKSNEQAIQEMTAEKNRQLTELRKQWRAEAKELMADDPVYSVWYAVQKEGKMDYLAVQEIAGDYIAQRLRAMGLVTAPGRRRKDGSYPNAKAGKHPATMAAQAGFDSVEEMIDQLLASKSPQDFTAEYMADEERKFNAEFEMSEKAQSVQASIEALEKLSEMLAVKGGQIGYRFRRALLKQQAIAELNSMSVAHIVSDKKLIADCRMNARALTKAANEGDFKGAFEHAKALRFNLEVLRMKGDAKKVVDDTIGLLRKGRHAKKGTIYGDHQDALMDLSFRFGFTNNLPKIQHDVASVVREFNEEAEANNDMPLDVPDWMLNFSMDYRKMTFGQFQELKNLADFLYGEGKELVSAREETFRNSVKAAVEGTVAELKDQKHKYTRSTNFIVKGWRGMVNWGTKLRNIVGMATDWNPDSTLQKLYDEMAFAESEQTQVMAEPMRQCTAALDALYKATRGLNLEAIADIPFPQDVKAEGYRQWDAEKVVAACLNMGTLKNKQRLIDGYEWGEKGDEYVSRIASLLTAEDWANIQAIWDAMAQLTPRTAQTFKEEYHYDLKLEEAAPFTVNTKDGQEIDVRGGYYPLEYLYHKNTVVNDKVDALKNAPKFRRASFTFERNEQVTDPLALSLNTVFNHIFDASHYISHRHVMRKVLRVINDRAFRSHFQQTQGFERYAALKALIENVAAPGAALKGMTSEFENWGRAVVTASALWASPSVVAMQLSSITYGLDELGGYYLEAASENMAHPIDTFKFVMAHSGMMRDRVNLKDLDLKMRANEFRQNQAQHIRSVVTQIGYSPMRFVDLAVAIPAWKAAYDKALDEGKSDSHAVAAADEFVAKTQGATRAIDLSPLQLKPWGRGLTVFFSAVSAGSTMGTKTISKVFGGKMSAGEAAYSATMNLVLPLLFSCLIRYAVSGAGGGDPDKARRAFLRELMTNPFQGVPVLRDVADFAAGRVLNPSGKTQRTVFENTSLRGASDLVVTAFDGVEAAFEENPDRAMYKLADAVGTLFQVPVVRVYERLRQMLVDWTGDEKILPDIDEETKHKKSNKKRRRH